MEVSLALSMSTRRGSSQAVANEGRNEVDLAQSALVCVLVLLANVVRKERDVATCVRLARDVKVSVDSEGRRAVSATRYVNGGESRTHTSPNLSAYSSKKICRNA